MTNIHKTILGQHGASDTRKGTEGGSWGVARRLGAGQLALYKVAQKMHKFQFLEGGFPWTLEC